MSQTYRYIGNKRALTGKIVSAIGDEVVPGKRVIDAMSGTGAISSGLRLSGYAVTAVDIMSFAGLHATVRLLINKSPSFVQFGGYDRVISLLNHLEPIQGLFFQEYSDSGNPSNGVRPRQYLLGSNAMKVDAILEWLDANNSVLTEYEHRLLRHDLILAVNRVANIAGTYGHYRSSWNPAALKELWLTPSSFHSENAYGHEVHVSPIEKIAPYLKGDLCYVDPPYLKRQYAANYHLLETIARGDRPTPRGVSGLRDWRDQYSDFCSKLKIEAAFDAMIEPMDCPRFLISYSSDGLIPLTELIGILEKHGKTTVTDFKHKRFKSNKGGIGGDVTEYLISLHR